MKTNKIIILCLVVLSAGICFNLKAISPTDPIGTIELWPNIQTIPYDYLACDGTLVDPARYPELYALLGDSYSTDKQCRLPDLNVIGAIGAPETVMEGSAAEYQGTTDRPSYITYICKDDSAVSMIYGYFWKNGTVLDPANCWTRFSTAYTTANFEPMVISAIIPKNDNYAVYCSNSDVKFSKCILYPFQATTTDQTLGQKKPSVVYIIKAVNSPKTERI